MENLPDTSSMVASSTAESIDMNEEEDDVDRRESNEDHGEGNGEDNYEDHGRDDAETFVIDEEENINAAIEADNAQPLDVLVDVDCNELSTSLGYAFVEHLSRRNDHTVDIGHK